MVAAFSFQAGLVSPYLSPAHPKPAETTHVSVSETHISSEQLFLCQWSQPGNYAPQCSCYSPLVFITSFFSPGAELTSDLKWTSPTARSHFLINSNQHHDILTNPADRLSCWGQPLLSHWLHHSSFLLRENAKLTAEPRFKVEVPRDRVLWGGKWNIACLCLCTAAVF